MSIRTGPIAAGLAFVLCAGVALAQPNAIYPSSSRQAVAGSVKSGHNGKAQINADVRADRIGKSEAKQLKQQLKAEKAQRRALKQARRGQGYQPANYPMPSPQQ